jgi:dihydrofolate reductase
MACSLDGFIASRNGSMDWLLRDQDYGYAEFLSRVDTVLMGRCTYDQVRKLGEFPYQGMTNFVFSHTRVGQSDEHVSYISGDISKFVRKLKSNPGRNIWLAGGAQIVREFMLNDLVSEIILSVHPLLLGDGIPLFIPPLKQKHLHLHYCRTFDTGLVQLTYGQQK